MGLWHTASSSAAQAAALLSFFTFQLSKIMVMTDAVSQFSNGMTGFRLLVFVFLPAFDVATDVAFIASFASSCVKTVLDFDQSGGIFWAVSRALAMHSEAHVEA
jgi:hypothetical protein